MALRLPVKRPERASEEITSKQSSAIDAANRYPLKGCSVVKANIEIGIWDGQELGLISELTVSTLREKLLLPDVYTPGNSDGLAGNVVSSDPGTPDIEVASFRRPKPSITICGVQIVPSKLVVGKSRLVVELDSRSNISTNKPESGREDHSAFAVT